jgi:Tfp pilus assembly PilM family ATPase
MDSILGLEFAPEQIRILEMSTTQRGLAPLNLAKIELPVNSIREGVLVEPKFVAERISAFIKENKISTKKAIILLNPPYVFTRISRLPHNLSDSQIRMNLEAELNQYQIFMGKEIVIDFKKVEEISEEGIKKVNILFAATFRAVSESYLKTLELAGLDSVGMDVPILSLIRLLDEVDFKSSSLDVTLLMSIGQKYLEICILKGNRPRFLHAVEIETYDFDKDKAAFIDRLISAIKLVVNFYQARLIHGEQISRIVIKPRDKKYNQIHALLQDKFPQIPIQLCDPLNKIYIDKEKSLDLDELRFGFSGLLGAILRIDNKIRPLDLNLLLEQKTKREYRLTQIYLLLISLGLVFSVMILSLGWVGFNIYVLQRKLSFVNLQLEQPSVELNIAMAIKEKKDILQRKIDEASKITRQLKSYFYFKNIAKAMVLLPQDLWLTEVALEEDNKNLVLNGESKTEKSIFNYASYLSDSGYFNSAELVSSESGAESIKFVIRCAIK